MYYGYIFSNKENKKCYIMFTCKVRCKEQASPHSMTADYLVKTTINTSFLSSVFNEPWLLMQHFFLPQSNQPGQQDNATLNSSLSSW